MNNFAVKFLFEKGVGRVTISPEDNLKNITSILDLYQNKVDLITYSDIPLFVSDTPAEYGDKTKLNDEVIVKDGVNYVFGKYPYCIVKNVKRLYSVNFRLDFCFKKYSAESVYNIFKSIQSGDCPNEYITTSNLIRGFC